MISFGACSCASRNKSTKSLLMAIGLWLLCRIRHNSHTFAARALINWYRTGKDPEQEMVKLSTYLGHAKPANTYWYIEAVPELLELAAERAAQMLGWEAGR
jgi:integrase/recombinase XerD